MIPTLTLFTTIMLVVGGVIGSGIFRKPGVMAGQLGSPELLLGVWLLAGIITLMGALTNAEIAGMIPETGGQYVYFDRIYGPFAGFLYGWSIFSVMQTGSIAALAYVFAEYAAAFFRLPDVTGPAASFSVYLPFIGHVTPLKESGIKAVAAAVIIVLTAVNYIGTKFGGWVQNIFTFAKLGGMFLLVLAAFFLPNGGTVLNLQADSPVIQPHGLALWAALAAGLQGAFWAYDGWNKITFVSGEVLDPQRNVPRSLFIGMSAVMAVYLLMNAAYTFVLPIDAMASSKLVAADVAEKCFPGGGKWIALVVMVSTFGAANSSILSSARVYFSMARRKVFPGFLGVAHPKFHTPGAALILQAGWSLLLLSSGTFDTLTDTLIFVSWIFYGASAYGVIALRRREPETPRPYKVPGYPALPWIFVLFSVVFLVLTIYGDITNYRNAVAAGKPAMVNSAFGIFLVLLGTPIYLCYKLKRSAFPNSRRQ